jgi:CHAT domain-containing protein
VARKLLARALRVARRRRLHDVEHRAERTLARADVARGKPGQELPHYLRAVAAYERLRAGIRSDQDRLAFASDKSAVFEEAMRAALDLGQSEVAFDLLERARARALVDLLAADPRFVAAVLASGSRLSRRLARLRTRLGQLESRERSTERRDRSVPPEVVAELRRALAEEDAALDRLALEAPEASYAVAGWPVAPLEEIRRVLGRDRALVTYFVEGDRIGAAVVTDRTRFRRGMARRVEVDRALAQLRFALATPRIDPERERLHRSACREAAEGPLAELHRLLIEPIEPWFGDRSLAIVPDARLHLVPFHALGRKGTPLFAEREVTTIPSGTVLVRALARRPRTTASLVVSVPDRNAPAIGAEADAVARALGGARRLSGKAATVAAFRAAAPRARLLHLATHGIFEPNEPLLSGLRLADGRLTLPEVSALGLDAQLVTLASCESAVGSPTGDEVLGLVRSFLQAGTRSLVAALWPVADAATGTLMEAFYRKLARGAGIAESLAAAALELRSELPHPYHWAPFLVVGDWGPLYWEVQPAAPRRSPTP